MTPEQMLAGISGDAFEKVKAEGTYDSSADLFTATTIVAEARSSD